MLVTKGTVRVVPDADEGGSSARRKRGEIILIVKSHDGETATFAVKGELTVGQLKVEIERETGLPRSQQRLQREETGVQLGDNGARLDEYAIEDGCTLMLTNNGMTKRVSFNADMIASYQEANPRQTAEKMNVIDIDDKKSAPFES
jgi:hypothetical protein